MRCILSNSILIALFLIGTLTAQTDDFLKDNLDRVPENVGGKVQLDRFIENHLVYPDAALKAKREGKTEIRFLVMKDGKALKPEVTVSAGPELDAEAIRLFKMLEWIPAEKEGEKVNTWHWVTIPFDIAKYKKYTKARGFVKPKLDKKTPHDTSNTVHEYPNQMADYYRGETGLKEYIQENIEYPEAAKKQNLEGTVQMSFIVEKNGMVSNIRIKKGVGGGCNEEAIALILGTRWKPAVHQGKIVRSRYQYALGFSLNNIYKSNELGEQK